MSQGIHVLILPDGDEFPGSRDELINWANEGRMPKGSMIRLDTGETVEANTLDWLDIKPPERTAPPQFHADIDRSFDRSTMDHLIPARNVPALLSWYFGIFGLIPFLGIPLAITAIILGIIGLKKSRDATIAVGFWHALLGLLIGGAGFLLWGSLLTIIIVNEGWPLPFSRI